MKLLELVNTYVTFKRSLGMRFATQPRVLRRFSRLLGDIEVCEVTPEAVRAFLDGDRSGTNTWSLNYKLLRGLFKFAISRGFTARSPLPDVTPAASAPFRPHIYSTNELTALLTATSVLKSCRNPMQPITFRVLLLLLYSTGIRVGEALRLTLRDVDLHSRAIGSDNFMRLRRRSAAGLRINAGRTPCSSPVSARLHAPLAPDIASHALT